MKKTLQTFFPLPAMCLFSGAIFFIINLIYPIAPLSTDTPLGLTRTITSPSQQTCSIKPASGDTCSGEIPSGCTVFTVSKGDRVFFGGNDDYFNPDSYYWVDPGGTQGYGAIWIGKPDNVQQGVNAKGLAYDANGLPRVEVNPHPERRAVSGGYSSYPIQILRECATVEEVIEWVNTHQWHSFMHDQLHFADATGDAVIALTAEAMRASLAMPRTDTAVRVPSTASTPIRPPTHWVAARQICIGTDSSDSNA